MLAIPRVELRGGHSVRPAGGSTVGGELLGNPVAVARSWAHAGFLRVHLVDSDAVAGSGSNAMLVDDVIRDGSVDVDACDAAQSTERIEELIDAGATRVVVGPRALEDADWIAGAADLYPGMLIVATSVRERRVFTRGWVRSLPFDILDVVHELNGLPLGGLLVDMSGELTRSGADLCLLEDIAETCAFPLIASGCVSTMSDLHALEHRGVAAVLLGHPLYAGELDPRDVAMEFGE